MSGKYDPDSQRYNTSHRINYDPNDLILISQEEIDRQAKEAMEIMKKNSPWREHNIKANQWKGEL